MGPMPPHGSARPILFGTAAVLLVLLSFLAFDDGHWLIVTLACGLGLLGAVFRLLGQAELRMRLAELEATRVNEELLAYRAEQEARSHELALLGRYGNLLLACTDLAEALQTSEQMLSLLLPDCAGTIYPLMDGEGLAEATHLWGVHAGETRSQAGPEDCLCQRTQRTHLADSEDAAGFCSHIVAPASGPGLSVACIPLSAQGNSFGWICLTRIGAEPMPRLHLAMAAADQLALALANLKLRLSLRDLSVRDPLTGLFNRRFLSESLGREVARCTRRGMPLAVLAFDLDRFKVFNDEYGHAAGDAVLVAFARVLRNTSRSEDIACRQGGEEFLLILPEMTLEVAIRRSTELMQKMAQTDVMHDGRLLPKLTTSVGVAVFPVHGTKPDDLLNQADRALYLAKAQGRNQVVVATPLDVDSVQA